MRVALAEAEPVGLLRAPVCAALEVNLRSAPGPGAGDLHPMPTGPFDVAAGLRCPTKPGTGAWQQGHRKTGGGGGGGGRGGGGRGEQSRPGHVPRG